MKIHENDPHYEDKKKAVELLSNVIDPELMVNIIDLGLIYDVTFTSSNEIHVLMTLSTPHCPMGESIVYAVKNALLSHFTDKNVDVTITFEPQWSMDNITEEGKRQLMNR